jgi:hypothetical protein
VLLYHRDRACGLVHLRRMFGLRHGLGVLLLTITTAV